MLKVFIRNHIEIMLKTNKGHCPRCILSPFLRCTDSFWKGKRLAVQKIMIFYSIEKASFQKISLLKIKFEEKTMDKKDG